MKPTNRVGRSFLRVTGGVLVGSVAFVGAIFLLVTTLGSSQAIYEGKPLHAWLTELRSHDSGVSNSAQVVVVKTIVPELSNALFSDTNDSRVRITLIGWLNALPGVTIFYPVAETRRAYAATCLGDCGSAAVPAVPVLIRALESGDASLRCSAARSLGKLHAEPTAVIPILIKQLDDHAVKKSIALALADYGPAAESALPKLLPMANAQDKALRGAVRKALQSIDPNVSFPSAPSGR